MSHKKRLGWKSSDCSNYLQAYLEVDPLNWTIDENTPQVEDDEATQSKQRKTMPVLNDDLPVENETAVEWKPVSDALSSIKTKKVYLERNLFSDIQVHKEKIELEDPFSNLVDELLLSIFSYISHTSLTKCVQVCKRWKQLGYDAMLWKEVNLDGKHITCCGVLGSILHRGVKILRLSKAEILAPICENDCNTGNENTCGIFALTQLDASMTIFDGDNLACMLFRCHYLKCLSLEGCKMGIREITAVSYNHGLEVLNLALCSGLTPPAIDVMTRKCSQLKSLNLSWTNQTRDCIRYICRCKQMQELNLSGLRGGVNRKVMEALVTSCKELIALDLSDVTLQIGTLKLIADNCTFLRKLSISRCSDIKAEQLLELLKLSNLSHLDLFGFVNSEILERLTNAKPDLYINKGVFSPIARPISTDTYEGKLWEQYTGFII